MDIGRFEVKLPNDILQLISAKSNDVRLSSDALYLYPYIKNETISYGRAAQILGISKWELIKIYGEFEIPYIDMEMDELERDIEAIDRIRGISK